MKNTVYLILLIAICSCSSRREIKTYYTTGELASKYFIDKNDSTQLEGIYTEYYRNGNIKEETEYQKGVIHGSRTLFYEDGGKMIKEHYVAGDFHGDYYAYYPSGNNQTTGKYDKNIMSGIWHFHYDTAGSPIKESVTFVDNVENGPFIEYYKDGQVAATGNYLNELEHGLTIVYAKNGDTLKRIEYDNGRPINYKEYPSIESVD